VLDPFLGMGTTMKVARGLGRRGIGYEINENYKTLIEKAISQEMIFE
jgi:DNA modification methylase